MLARYTRKGVSTLKKYSYILKNLSCPNCANKIETLLKKEEGFSNVVLNFNTLKLSFETIRTDHEEVVKGIIGKVEPDVEVILEGKEVEKKEHKNSWFPIVRLVVGIILGLIGGYTNILGDLSYICIVLAYIILLYRTGKVALKLLIKNRTINENFLITVSCIGAYLVNEHMEGLMVIILYEIGKILEDRAVRKSRKSISELMDIRPEYANLKVENEHNKVLPEDVKIGDIIIVKQGEKIPLDGKVISGVANLDMSSLTGESAIKEINVGDEVLSGSINVEGLIEVQVTAEYVNSTVSKILELVENATDKKARTETFVAKAAKIYTPIVLGLAIVVAIFMPMVISGITYNESIYRALIFLVIACPCAIAISVPLSYFSGIGRASKSGILIKGSDYLDELKNIGHIIFDKTGTLTTGSFNVSEINSFNSDYSENDILELAAAGEKFSNHPISKSILKKANHEIDSSGVMEYKEISGSGIEYKLGNDNIRVGNQEFVGIEEANEETDVNEGVTIIYLRKNEEILGNIVIKDEIKAEAKGTISSLKKLGIKVSMFTGDNRDVAAKVANEIEISDFRYEMLPADKYKEVEDIISKTSGKRVCFIGDGINDSPVLAISDIGISMGGVGSSSAIEASDIVIMTDNLNKIVEGISISKKTGKVIKQNLIFAISTKILVLLLSTIGFARYVAGNICGCGGDFNYNFKYTKNIKKKIKDLAVIYLYILAIFFLYYYISVSNHV